MIYKVRNLEPGSISKQMVLSQDSLWKVKMKILEEVKKLLPPECWCVNINLEVKMEVENKPSTWTMEIPVVKEEKPITCEITLTKNVMEVEKVAEENK